jgi:hypothetical protein
VVVFEDEGVWSVPFSLGVYGSADDSEFVSELGVGFCPIDFRPVSSAGFDVFSSCASSFHVDLPLVLVLFVRRVFSFMVPFFGSLFYDSGSSIVFAG